MKNKKLFIVWCISLIVVAVITLVLSIAKGMGASIPDMVVRIMGLTELILIFVMGTRFMKKDQDTEE